MNHSASLLPLSIGGVQNEARLVVAQVRSEVSRKVCYAEVPT